MSQHHKPFNLDHAKAGAPVQTRKGLKARIVCFNRGHATHPLISLVNHNDDIYSHTDHGTLYSSSGSSDIDLVMAPLGFIEGRPVFVGDTYEWKDGTEWHSGVADPADRIDGKASEFRWPQLRTINVWRNKIGGGLYTTVNGDSDDNKLLLDKSWECIKSFEEPAV